MNDGWRHKCRKDLPRTWKAVNVGVTRNDRGLARMTLDPTVGYTGTFDRLTTKTTPLLANETATKGGPRRTNQHENSHLIFRIIPTNEQMGRHRRGRACDRGTLPPPEPKDSPELSRVVAKPSEAALDSSWSIRSVKSCDILGEE